MCFSCSLEKTRMCVFEGRRKSVSVWRRLRFFPWEHDDLCWPLDTCGWMHFMEGTDILWFFTTKRRRHTEWNQLCPDFVIGFRWVTWSWVLCRCKDNAGITYDKTSWAAPLDINCVRWSLAEARWENVICVHDVSEKRFRVGWCSDMNKAIRSRWHRVGEIEWRARFDVIRQDTCIVKTNIDRFDLRQIGSSRQKMIQKETARGMGSLFHRVDDGTTQRHVDILSTSKVIVHED